MSDFNMPATGSWEVRGGWVVQQLSKDCNLLIEQAAGLVGNLGYESKGFTTLQEERPKIPGSRGGAGFAQWTGPRRIDFENFASSQGLATNSDEANYRFLVFELLGKQKAFLSKLRKTATIEDACRLTHTLYERPQDVLDGSYRSGADRLKWAKRALAGAGSVEIPIDPPEVDVCFDNLFREIISSAAKTLQLALRETGDYDGEIDGIAGAKTSTAAMDFHHRAP